MANVIPLFEKGCGEKTGNYMLVSLTSVVGNLLEGISRDMIYMHLVGQGLIRNGQHGFARGRSCLTNMIDFFFYGCDQNGW